MTRGVSIILTIIILAVILSIALGLSAILVGQIKTIREMGNSVIAFYAADSGVERVLEIVLEYIRNGGTTEIGGNYQESNIGNNASYNVDVECCDSGDSNCYYDNEEFFCPFGSGNTECQATYFCINSSGIYGQTKRKIKVEVFSVD